MAAWSCLELASFGGRHLTLQALRLRTMRGEEAKEGALTRSPVPPLNNTPALDAHTPPVRARARGRTALAASRREQARTGSSRHKKCPHS